MPATRSSSWATTTWRLSGSREPLAAGWLRATSYRPPATSHQLLNNPRQLLIVRLRRFAIQVAIEQHVAPHSEHPVLRATAVAQFLLRGETDGGATVADDQRRDRHMEPIEQTGLHERR